MALNKKCGNDSDNEQQQQERGIKNEHSGKGNRSHGLLNEAAHLLDHRQPVSGLDSRALKAVVENGVLVDCNVEGSGFAHDFNADMVRVPVGEQVVKVVDGARKDTHEDCQPHFRGNEPPETVRQRLMKADTVHAVNDVTDNDPDADGQKRDNDADGNVPENNRRPGFPNKMKHRRNVLKRCDTIRPCAMV